jgi:hypothetical protein
MTPWTDDLVKKERYVDVREEMGMGDLISVAGQGRISNVIKNLAKIKGGMEISHSSMVIRRLCPITGEPNDSVEVTESTSISEVPDSFDGPDVREIRRGVACRWLSQLMKEEDDCVYYWSRLKKPLTTSEKDHLWEHIRHHHSKKTPYDTAQAMGAGMDFWDYFFENERDLSKLFCSEWVTYLLQEAQRVDRGVNYSEIQPFEVLNFPCYEPPVIIEIA